MLARIQYFSAGEFEASAIGVRSPQVGKQEEVQHAVASSDSTFRIFHNILNVVGLHNVSVSFFFDQLFEFGLQSIGKASKPYSNSLLLQDWQVLQGIQICGILRRVVLRFLLDGFKAVLEGQDHLFFLFVFAVEVSFFPPLQVALALEVVQHVGAVEDHLARGPWESFFFFVMNLPHSSIPLWITQRQGFTQGRTPPFRVSGSASSILLHRFVLAFFFLFFYLGRGIFDGRFHHDVPQHFQTTPRL
mmetsp:Transcript_5868/g.36384  ORF Transcript_5868/g.36384 Transcript_5868/m.36384 type:complete len:246 (+) Transcript_5868:3515-4252(+)